MEASTDLFINLIQSNRILYDKSMKDFKNTRKKEEVWQRVAQHSKMTVDAAKKRYASLRQKYCREKRNIEVKRRNKCATKRYWVYFERLHFLDSFIQPRSTFTNDTLFEEENDEDLESVPNIEIQLEVGIEIDELKLETIEAASVVEEHANQMEINENEHSDKTMGEQNQRTVTERVISKYTGEMSTIIYASEPDEISGQSVHQNDSTEAVDNGIVEATLQEQIEESMNGYMSPNPHSSFSNDPSRRSGLGASVAMKPPPDRNIKNKHIPARSESISRPRPSARQVSPSTSTSNDTRSSLQHQTIIDLTAPKNSNPSRSAANRNNQTIPRADAAMSTATTAQKDQRIEAIRQRMESCLTAITNKVTEKSERSPHAPFLAYLGTKLPLVPPEILPNLEREILELVIQHSI